MNEPSANLAPARHSVKAEFCIIDVDEYCMSEMGPAFWNRAVFELGFDVG